MKPSFRCAMFVALASALGVAACAQSPQPAAPAATPAPDATQAPASAANTLSVNAKLVLLPTIVRDHKGALVNNLTKDDFSLQVDSKPQAIRYFDHDNNVPLTLGLLVDVSLSQRKVLDEERDASQAFLDTLLAPSGGSTGTGAALDRAFVVQFARDIELLQDVTSDKPRIQHALKELGTESPTFHNTDDTTDTNSSDNGRTDSEGRYVRHGGTALYDAIFLSGDEITSKQTGRRRAVIVLTDGVDRGSKESLPDAIEAAQRSDTIVYGIYYKGESPRQNFNRPGGGHRGGMGGGWPGGYPGGYPGGGYPGGGYPGGNNPQGGNGGQYPRGGGGDHKPSVDGKQVLARICGETGGRVFEVSKKEPIDDIYKQIGEELRSQYRLGFTPTGDAARDRYHQISLALTGEDAKKKLDVQVRDGYYMTAH